MTTFKCNACSKTLTTENGGHATGDLQAKGRRYISRRSLSSKTQHIAQEKRTTEHGRCESRSSSTTAMSTTYLQKAEQETSDAPHGQVAARSSIILVLVI